MISSFINTSFILGAIVFGLALPGLLFYRQNPWCNLKTVQQKADILSALYYSCDFFLRYS